MQTLRQNISEGSNNHGSFFVIGRIRESVIQTAEFVRVIEEQTKNAVLVLSRMFFHKKMPRFMIGWSRGVHPLPVNYSEF